MLGFFVFLFFNHKYKPHHLAPPFPPTPVNSLAVVKLRKDFCFFLSDIPLFELILTAA